MKKDSFGTLIKTYQDYVEKVKGEDSSYRLYAEGKWGNQEKDWSIYRDTRLYKDED